MAHLINSTQLAKLLGVSVLTIQRWARQGVIPAFKVGPRLYRFDADRVMKHLHVEVDA